jgi:DNA polymerase
MRDTFHDLETRSPVPIKDGPHAYAEQAEVMLWAYAIDNGPVHVWDLLNGTNNWCDENGWHESAAFPGETPWELERAISAEDSLCWFHNGGMFDFVVIDKVLPHLGAMMPLARRRDTMVQAYAHSLPGSLDKLGTILKLKDDKLKSKRGRELIRLFCIPHEPDAFGSIYRDKKTNPAEWQEFIEYAAQDIATMRAAHRIMPTWNYREGKQMDLWHADLIINNRGFKVDIELAEAAIRAAEKVKATMAKRTVEMTDGAVDSATQRDRLKDYLAAFGVDLPDMRADTLERRMNDPDLPPEAKELLGIRLRASMNSPAKYGALLRGVSVDGRLRGTAQFRGAGRTGRWAHRLFQPGNLPRPAYSWPFIEACVAATKVDCLDLLAENPMEACASMIRSAIVASPGKKLVVADLSNIEGRVAAWLAGEEWKLEAFRAYDRGEGPDLYVIAYCKSFNVDALDPDPFIAKSQRQIGKVQELMFQYGGGVGAWITGAATYGIDLDAMTEAVYDTLPVDVREEAEQFLVWVEAQAEEKRDAALKKLHASVSATIDAEDYAAKVSAIEAETTRKARYGLDAKVFVTCDALKRLWRRAHPMISSYWKDLEETIKAAIDAPGVTFPCRKVKIRRDGSWLRIMLPSGRYLCFPGIHLTKKGEIAYTGQNTYTRQWGVVTTYGGKTLEQCTQAAANDQFAECMPLIEAAGYPICGHVHDEDITEPPDTDDYTPEGLAALMCADLGWNEGLPLAAAGETMRAYHK